MACGCRRQDETAALRTVRVNREMFKTKYCGPKLAQQVTAQYVILVIVTWSIYIELE